MQCFENFRGGGKWPNAPHLVARLLQLITYKNVCILDFFDSRSSRVFCDNATRVMCVANVIFGQEGLTMQFFSMRFFYSSIFLFTIQCSSPSEHFAFNALFLWEHSLVHLKALRCGELRLVRTVGMVGLDKILWNFEQKMALTLKPPPQVPCSPSSAQTNNIIKTVYFSPEST